MSTTHTQAVLSSWTQDVADASLVLLHIDTRKVSVTLALLVAAAAAAVNVLTSSSVSRVRAACRIFDRAICTRQSSLLLRSPYSPTSLSSPSRRSFSKGRLGFLKVLPSALHSEVQTKHRSTAHSAPNTRANSGS